MFNTVREFFGMDDEEAVEQAPTPPEVLDLQWVMSDKRGRRHVWRQLELAGVYRLSYTGDEGTIFNEGQRNMGLRLLGDITTHCPEQYIEMLKEQSQ
ncbi:hypothetical protein [Hydrogenophaga sp.]|uniref:Bbp19 family protein n=1 Tax=Hydrogenophaga sp. TaxID=1904254 RepID=UPI0025B9598D|nr:hypothetical protein [Hydrogenophaga sp.]MBT9467210.1 hypothetical protein [Hydrogenophaga sp.]